MCKVYLERKKEKLIKINKAQIRRQKIKDLQVLIPQLLKANKSIRVKKKHFCAREGIKITCIDFQKNCRKQIVETFRKNNKSKEKKDN